MRSSKLVIFFSNEVRGQDCGSTFLNYIGVTIFKRIACYFFSFSKIM